MRIISFLLSLISLSSPVFAFEARVLIDEFNNEKVITGTLWVSCKDKDGHTCDQDKLKLRPGTWKFNRHKNVLRLKNVEENLSREIKGGHFVLTGSFSLENRVLQKVSLYFENKKTLWVLHLPVDQYLYGVMAAEVPSSWPEETLKAQAIASRTYFLFKKQERKAEVFDVRSDTMDQVFKMDAKKHKNIVKAVNETHGQILTSKKTSQIFPAYFHADCGGGTSQEKVVWRQPTSLNVEVKDPYCQSASKNNWSILVDKAKLTRLLKDVFFLPFGVNLKSILPRLGEKSRAHVIDFVFSNNIIKRLEANEFRRLLGFSKLRSTHFAVTHLGESIEFKGRGFGHGVGMCQWGAQRWARNGKNFKEILSHYYPNAQLEKVSSQRKKSLQAEVH